ncbi:MAG: hypothetical protein ACRDIB_06195 [Ardenticatenaceae bacterium]
MRTTKHAAIVLMGFALLLLVGTGPAFAQAAGSQPPSQPPAAQERAKAPAPIEGDLVRVDAEAKKLIVKTAAGANVEFLYNDTTEVTGAKDGAAGLATMKEGRVTVHFTEDAQAKTRTATRIIIQPKQ